MVKMTLDFSSSYRAITNADLVHELTRETLSWNGQDIPIHQVILRSPTGDFVIPASTFAISTPYVLSHSASSNQFDLFSTENIPLHAYLSFPITVNGPPLCENYVQAIYSGDGGGIAQYAMDKNAFGVALLAWIHYMETHQFKASTSTLTDDGGGLGNFSSDSPTLIENFQEPTTLFSSIIRGSAFDDSFSAGLFACTLYGDLGDDTLTGQGADDAIFGGNGVDYLFGGEGLDLLFGGDGADTMYGGIGSDILKGGNNADVMYGDVGNDNLSGQSGSDTLWGDDGNDSLDGGADFDTLNGGTGADTLIGDVGSDALSGGEGKDVLYGGDGDDFLRGGLDKDTLTGGAGIDTFNFNYLGDANADKIIGFVAGTDRIALSSGTFPEVHASLDPQEFRLGIAAQDHDDRILYDSASGRLYYDADGTRNGASGAPPVLFAIVTNHSALTWQDFYVL